MSHGYFSADVTKEKAVGVVPAGSGIHLENTDNVLACFHPTHAFLWGCGFAPPSGSGPGSEQLCKKKVLQYFMLVSWLFADFTISSGTWRSYMMNRIMCNYDWSATISKQYHLEVELGDMRGKTDKGHYVTLLQVPDLLKWQPIK